MQYILTKDGQPKFVGSEGDCYIKLQKLQGQSADYAMEHGGWKITREDRYGDRFLTWKLDNDLAYVDSEIYVWSGNASKYEGELKQGMIERCKRIKKRIESSGEMVVYEIKGLDDYRDGIYMMTKKDDDGEMKLCKNIGSNHVSDKYEGASTSGGPRMTFVDRNGVISKQNFEYNKETDKYDEVLTTAKSVERNGEYSSQVRTRRASACADGGMYFIVEFPKYTITF